MSFKLSKCETCKNFKIYNEAPWVGCTKNTIIPEEYYQNPIDSNDPVKCPKYEYNADWRKRYDE